MSDIEIKAGYAYNIDYKYKDDKLEIVRTSFVVVFDDDLESVYSLNRNRLFDKKLKKRYGLLDENVVFYANSQLKDTLSYDQLAMELAIGDIELLNINYDIEPAFYNSKLWAIIWSWEDGQQDFELWYGEEPTPSIAEACIAYNCGEETVEDFRQAGGTIVDIVSANRPFTLGEYENKVKKHFEKGAKND